MSANAQIFLVPPAEPGALPTAVNPRHIQKPAPVARLETGLAAFVVLSLALVSLPNGGNHPVAWLGWAAAIGMVTAYCVNLTGVHHLLPRGTARLLAAAGAAFAASVLLQAAIGGLARSGAWPAPWPAGSIAPGATLVAFMRMAGFTLFFVLACAAARRAQMGGAMLVGLFWLIGLHGAVALVTRDTPIWGAPGINHYAGYATGLFVNRNALAAFLGLGAIIGAALLTSASSRRSGGPAWLTILAHGLCLGVILAALAATGSRLGLAAAIAGMGVTVLLPGRRRTAGIALCLALAAGAVLFVGAPALERAARLGEDIQARTALYGQVLQMISERPFTGFGADAFPLAFERYHRPPVSSEVVWDRAHSSLLTLWAEAGLLAGSLPAIAGALALFALLHRAALGNANSIGTRAAAGGLTAAGLHGAFDFSLEIPANTLSLLLLVAIALAPAPDRKGMNS